MNVVIIIFRFQSIQIHLDITINQSLNRRDITCLARCSDFLSTQSTAVGITTNGSTQQIHSRGVFGCLGSICPTPIVIVTSILFQIARVGIGQRATTIDILSDATAQNIDTYVALHIAGFTTAIHTLTNNGITADNNIRIDVSRELAGVVVHILEIVKMRLAEILARTTAAAKDATVNGSALDIDQRV